MRNIDKQIRKMSIISEELDSNEKYSLESVRRNFELLPKKAKLRLLIKFFIIIICLFGLIINSIDLFIQYSSGRTVVNMIIEIIKYNKLPAITICLPLYSMKRLAEKYEELKPLYDEYGIILENMAYNDYKNETLYRFLNSLYSDNFTAIVNKSELNIEDLFNLSVPFELSSSGTLIQNLIQIETIGYRRFKNGSVTYGKVSDRSPIESIAVEPHPQFGRNYKCFTFFSHLNRKWRKYQMDVKTISITIFFMDKHVPRTVFYRNPMKVSMHSPHTVPKRLRVNDFVDVKARRNVDLTYCRWKTVLLGPKYQTNCRDYDLDDNQYHRFRSDCVNQCYNQKFNECAQNKKALLNQTREECLFPMGAIWNNQTFPMDRRMKICHFSKQFSDMISEDNMQCLLNPIGVTDCELTCRSECVNRYYNYDIKKSERNHDWAATQITIRHNQMPDLITEHLPEMTFISFAANFGGLLGMWLGLSTLAIFDFLMKLF